MAKDSRGPRLSPAEELARIPLYEKGKPPQPLIDVDFVDEVELACGRRWGAQTELGTLRSVLVQAPTPGPVSAPIVREDPIFFAVTQGSLSGLRTVSGYFSAAQLSARTCARGPRRPGP
jgi:hypothetical protein